MKRIWIHFLYLVVFVLIPIDAMVCEVKRAFNNFCYISTTKRKMHKHLENYKHFKNN